MTEWTVADSSTFLRPFCSDSRTKFLTSAICCSLGELDVELVPVPAELDRKQDRDPERPTQLLGGVDHPGGAAAVPLGDRVEADGVVDREDDPES